MSRRIEIELTSVREDGTWTWRAAGARQPKGVLDASVLYSGAKVGDVMRAEADFDIDGISVLSVIPPKEKAAEPERLEVIGSGRDPGPGVTTSLVGRSGRRRDPFGEPRERRDDRRGPRPEGRGPRPEGAGSAQRGRGERPARPDGRAPSESTRERRPAEGVRRGPGRPGEGRPGEGRPGEGRPGRADAGPREGRGRRDGVDAGRRPAGRPAPKRLVPGTTHRDAVLATVAPEHHPIAQQVLRGGMPAVRQAIAADNEKAKAEGRPPTGAAPILAIAEELLPRLKTAEWRDRAEAAAAMGDEVGLRDLRSVVAGAEAAARDDETRMLAKSLREALHRRVEAQREGWIQEMATALEEGKVVRALRVSAKAPDPTVRLPAELALKLAEAAGAAMNTDAPVDRWGALLEAAAASPVRRSVKPQGLPEGAPEELLSAARHAAGQVPALAPLLGLSMPPAPGPARNPRALTARPGGPRRPNRPTARPVPPPPPASGSSPAAVAPAPPAPPEAEPQHQPPVEPVVTQAEPPAAVEAVVTEAEPPAPVEAVVTEPEPPAPVEAVVTEPEPPAPVEAVVTEPEPERPVEENPLPEPDIAVPEPDGPVPDSERTEPPVVE